jgi:inorganic triphosphatase YgiF
MTSREEAFLRDQQPLEVELKLATTAEAMESLLASPLLREHARSTVRSRHLVSTYFDTADQRLSRKRLSLRIRQSGRKLIQTLKTPNQADRAGAERGEWEVEVSHSTPHLTAFDDPAVLEVTGLILPDELAPVFETRFRRRAMMIEWPDGDQPPAQIEVAFDSGTIRADGREQPISELELELKRGQPRSLFELAEMLRAVAPLRLHTLDKAARGYLLASSEAPGWHKARPVTLAPGMLVDDALHQILGACIRHWLDNEAATLDGHDPEGLHQLRVALRRLRSALTLFKTAMDEATRTGWSTELRWLLGPLGPARDLDVFATEMLAPIQVARGDDPDLAALAAVVASGRQAAQAQLREALRSERYGDLALRLACWVERRGWRQGADVDVLLAQRQPVSSFATTILAKRHRQALKRGRHFAKLDPEQRHQLRIALKKLRYGAEFFSSLFEAKPVSRFRKAAAQMQDILGHLNDVAVAQDLVHGLLREMPEGTERTSSAFGAGQVIGWYARQSMLLEPQAVEAWKAFRKAKPYWTDDA